jgi:hypothetical protein
VADGLDEAKAAFRGGVFGHELRVMGHKKLRWLNPNTTRSVQGWLDEGISEDENTYHTMECAACGQVHLVSPATGRVLRLPGDD